MRTARGVVSLAGLLAACGLAQGGGIRVPAAPGHTDRQLSGRLLIRPIQESEWTNRGMGRAAAAARAEAARRRLAGIELSTIDASDIHVLAVPPGTDEASLAALLMATGDYDFAHPDWIVYPCDTNPDDPDYGPQWHLQKIRAPLAWDRTTGDGSMICAFVDTGVDLTHPDLIRNLVPGYNAVTHLTEAQGGQTSDVSGHGTAVAGAAAAMGNNNTGGCGVGWDLKIMPIRASNFSSGSAFLSDILWGATWAAVNGARVVSVSYGGVDTPAAEATGQVISGLYGGLLFWAAGNSNQSLPNDWPSVIIVGSTTSADQRAPDSNFGPAIDLVAPGDGIYTTERGGGYGWVSGTSYSTPIAAAVAALAWSTRPSLTPPQMMARLLSSCVDLGPPGEDDEFGRGRVDLFRLVEITAPAAHSEVGEILLASVIPMAALEHGLFAYYYESSHHTGTPWLHAGERFLGWNLVPSPAVPQPPPPPGLGADYVGYIRVRETAAYTFRLAATDGAVLWVDDVPVIWGLGLSPGQTRAGTVTLQSGMHRIHCSLYSVEQTPSLSVWIRGAGTAPALMDPTALWHLIPDLGTAP